jgi:hypothetical protein
MGVGQRMRHLFRTLIRSSKSVQIIENKTDAELSGARFSYDSYCLYTIEI